MLRRHHERAPARAIHQLNHLIRDKFNKTFANWNVKVDKTSMRAERSPLGSNGIAAREIRLLMDLLQSTCNDPYVHSMVINCVDRLLAAEDNSLIDEDFRSSTVTIFLFRQQSEPLKFL